MAKLFSRTRINNAYSRHLSRGVGLGIIRIPIQYTGCIPAGINDTTSEIKSHRVKSKTHFVLCRIRSHYVYICI